MGTQSNPYEFFNSMMKNMTVDREANLANHRKNIEMLTQASKMASEVLRSVTQLQQDYMKQTFETMSSMMKDAMGQKVTQESWTKHADAMKNQMNQSMEHGMTVASVLSKSHKQMYDAMKDHMTGQIKDSFQKKQKTH